MIEKISKNTYYLEGVISIGIIRTRKGLIVIDTGLDEGYGRKILRASKELGENIIGIINTHSHADHFGGNNFLKKRTNAWIMTSKIEKALIENPIFEPIYLFGGVPSPEMRTKFLEGKPSFIDMCVEEDRAKEILSELNIEIVEIPGHSPSQIGIKYEDTVYIGDVVMPEKVIEKYKISYLYDPKLGKESLKNIKDINARYFVSGHEKVLSKEKLEKLVEINLNNIIKIEECILDILKRPYSTEEAFSKFIEILGLNPDLVQILLLFSTFKGFLVSLREQKFLEFYTDRGKIIWKERA